MRIQTHHAPQSVPPWIALDMDCACAMLEPYDLDDAEKADIVEIMMGYCRLIDEADLIGYGDTEQQAIDNCKAKEVTP